MGKRYRCDYCDKHMVTSPSIIKTHNKGLFHQKLVNEYYQQYKDPETILAEESTKRPCNRFLQGTCSFGSICRNSHYTMEQINQFREYVALKHQPESFNQPSFEDLYHKLQENKSNTPQNEQNTVLYDNNGVTHVFPWTYNNAFDIYNEKPPSLRKYTIEDFKNVEIVDWG
ncbi:zinc finger matrin-type protein 5 [Hyposmocoma kahamanoa]|uniref:zinc finger matrin-type protein 5 n=1 Tax=Hyposmocoma kahamanoa TaxID=1477025 RepID=UPI000E6D9323|nr:zinc finger matrin-type protein 5 [Hyposmocoma kahamanoa]